MSVSAFPFVVCATTEPTATGMATAAQPSTAASVNGATTKTSPDTTVAQWNDIKNCTYDMRATFFAGLKQLEAKVDSQIDELKTRRAAMTSATDTKAWDFAMKEMADSRSFLKSVGEELGKASVDTWNQQKEAVGRAWERSQAAYDKVKSSVSS